MFTEFKNFGEKVRYHFQYSECAGLLIWKIPTSKRVKYGSVAGRISVQGYRKIGFCGKTYPAHHLVWAHKKGDLPQGNLDHINGDRSDNRIENLRIASREQNMQNVNKAYSASGLKGVTFIKENKYKKWRANIHKDGKNYFLGSYGDKLIAAYEYDKKAIELFGDFAKTNFELGLSPHDPMPFSDRKGNPNAIKALHAKNEA